MAERRPPVIMPRAKAERRRDPLRRELDGGRFLALAGTLVELVEDEKRIVLTVDEHEILVLAVEGTVYAVGNRCSHRPFWLDVGNVVPGSCEIECVLHRGRFSLKDGSVAEEPPTEPIPTYPVEVIDDDVFVVVSAAGAGAAASVRD